MNLFIVFLFALSSDGMVIFFFVVASVSVSVQAYHPAREFSTLGSVCRERGLSRLSPCLSKQQNLDYQSSLDPIHCKIYLFLGAEPNQLIAIQRKNVALYLFVLYQLIFNGRYFKFSRQYRNIYISLRYILTLES